MTDTIRLARHLATTLPCSRREAELYISNGWVRVDGVVVEEPQYPISGERVELDPNADLEPALPASVLLHKPAGVEVEAAAALMTPTSRSAADQTGVRMLKRHFLHQTSVIPLEAEASGLIMLTQDRQLARRLGEERDRFEQEFLVEIAGQLAGGGMAQLNRADGVSRRPPPTVKVSWQNETRLRIAGKGLRPGDIAELMAAVGLTVVSSRRLRIGRMPMAKLAPGEWRYLASYEKL